MKYNVEATFSYTGSVEVEADSAQEAVDFVREKAGGTITVNDALDNEPEIEAVCDEDGLPIREEWE